MASAPIELNVMSVIKAVEKRFPLYDSSKKEYHDRVLRQRLWNGVCKEVYTTAVWNSLSRLGKLKYEKEVLKKWNSLRNCFRRQLIEDRLFSAGKITKKKRRYLYFTELQFLLPFCEFEKTTKPITTQVRSKESFDNLCGNNNSDTSSDDYDGIVSSKIFECNVDEIDADTTTIKEEPGDIKAGTSTSPGYNVEMVTLPQLNQMNNTLAPPCQDSGQDDDDLFLRSLLPFFKEFSGDQKLELRMEVMKSIINFKKSLNYNRL